MGCPAVVQELYIVWLKVKGNWQGDLVVRVRHFSPLNTALKVYIILYNLGCRGINMLIVSWLLAFKDTGLPPRCLEGGAEYRHLVCKVINMIFKKITFEISKIRLYCSFGSGSIYKIIK